MMYGKIVDCADMALSRGLELLEKEGVERPSRNGPVLTIEAPVLIEYTHPRRRVLFSDVRDANPFFHLYEAVWMLGGRRDLAALTPLVANFGRFSDDGTTLHGAYGYRWRHTFGVDQLKLAALELSDNPDSRRVVVQMWDARQDVHMALNGGKDVPCNTQIYFRVCDGKLDMTVMNRSNDAVLGAFGANVVHFSFMHEAVALLAGIPLGKYYQFTNNLHVYTKEFDAAKREAMKTAGYSWAMLARADEYQPLPLTHPEGLLEDCSVDSEYWSHPYLTDVVRRALRAHELRKTDRVACAVELSLIACPAWRRACTDWIERRWAKEGLK